MPDTSETEYGGKVQKNRVQPTTPTGDHGFSHTPTPSEELMLGYTTGDTSGASDPDSGEAFAGLLPEEERLAELRQQGLIT